MTARRDLSRRRFLAGAGGLVVAGVVAGCAAGRSSTATGQATGAAVPVVAVGDQPAGLPVRQYAWEATLSRDRFGNAIAPRFDRLLMFDVKGTPTGAYRRLLEASLRRVERTYAWGPEGLLFVAAWGHGYFKNVVGTDPPIPLARALSNFEQPAIDDYDLCLHLACDAQQRLAKVSRQLIKELTPILKLRATRTGFTGAGLPNANQHVGGIPGGDPVAKSAPLYMGFKSNLKKNQASEDAVTLTDGPFPQGTTMQVSYMRLSLENWYRGLSDADRVALMYSPQTTVAQSRRFTDDAESNPGELHQAITKHAVIGHAQSSATARRGGKPIILRRDFDTTDYGNAGVHFVSLQESIEDFVKTRTAMNQAGAQLLNPAVTDTVNNGINAFIFVTRRGNFVVPSRADRSFPLMNG